MSYFTEAKDVIAGGVNSPVRAFAGVGGEPVFMKSAKGAWLETEDGRQLIDQLEIMRQVVTVKAGKTQALVAKTKDAPPKGGGTTGEATSSGATTGARPKPDTKIPTSD